MHLDSILKKLKNKLSQQEYDTYISLMEYDENASRTDMAVFYVPNIFVLNWIKSNYLDSIADAFEEESSHGIRPEIHIRVKEKKHNAKSQKSAKLNFQSNSLSLYPLYSFENFVVGKSNESAYNVAKMVADRQAVYNPVMIHGDSGLGKTHLLNAVGNHAKEQNKNVIYIPAEELLNEYIERIKRQTMDSFREKYRKCDYLLIDDVQFLGGKDGVQEELLNTFNTLYSGQKQIVMTSDKPPKEMRGLAQRLRSRFEGGIMVEITSPDLETKIEIIKSKCEINHIILNKEVIHYIASNIHGNIRQIEGILSTINLNLNLSPDSNPLKVAESVLKNYQNESSGSATFEDILNVVSKELNIKQSEITSKERTRKVAFARRVVIYLTRVLTYNSMPLIAKELGMKDHSSVSKAYKSVEEEMLQNSDTKVMIENIKSKIKQG